MKSFVKTSSLVVITVALAIAIFQIGCTKEGPVTDVALTKTQILVQSAWKIDQLHSVINGKYASYTRGGANSTGINYSNTAYTFKADGTGTYVAEVGTSHIVQWEFASPDSRTIKYTVYTSGVASVNNWVLVEIAGNYMHITQNFTVAGNSNCLQSYRLIQADVMPK